MPPAGAGPGLARDPAPPYCRLAPRSPRCAGRALPPDQGPALRSSKVTYRYLSATWRVVRR
nr:hypothetical protein [Actinomycetales bacterium]